jgi:hypothetical protein
MDDTPVAAALERAARLMDVSWERDVLPLRVSRLLHDRIGPYLSRLGTDGHIIGRVWYQDFVLSSIRRMVDTGTDAMSVRRAPLEVRAAADELTPEVLLDFHGPWHEDRQLDLQMAEETVRVTVVEARPNEPSPDTSVIGVRTVQADLDRIREVADRAYRLATLVSSHRLDLEEEVAVTDDEIGQLLTDISAIYQRWSLVLRAVSVDTDISRFQVGSRAAEALSLYDRTAVSDAVHDYIRTRREAGRLPPRAELVERIRVSYHLHDETEPD